MHSPNVNERLSEEYVQDAFHSYLKSSLTQAKAEKLLAADVLASAESDLMITGPALCLYFGALRCTTSPPSVPLPRNNKSSVPLDLSQSNCPPAFMSFFNVWVSAVPRIQSLAPEHQHDLARIICNLPPIASYQEPSLNGIAADLRAVAIEISQRRSFQERYTGDLQAALDAGPGGDSGLKVKATFVPPPEYQPSPISSPNSSPAYRNKNLPPSPPPQPSTHTSPTAHSRLHSPPAALVMPPNHERPPQSPSYLSPYFIPPSPSPSRSTASPSRTPSPTLLTSDTPAIEAIRETLYASLADVLDRTPSLRRLLKSDPPRAYFASVAFAILDIATTIITPQGTVIGVLGRELSIPECPPELRPFMVELAAIGRLATEMDEGDTEEAMKLAQEGKDIPPPRMDRVRKMLEEGIGYDLPRSSGRGGTTTQDEGRRSVEGRAVAFTNRINALALGLTRLKTFKERQRDVFKVLAGIGS